MTNQEHSIKPTPELVEMLQDLDNLDVIELAYQAGANWQLGVCVKWIEDSGYPPAVYENLRAACRPNLKKQACDALNTYIYGEPDLKDKERTYNTIRRALEALPND